MNFSRYLITVGFALLVAGCATTYVPPTPSYSPKSNAKIGILVEAKANPTHSHVGTTIFNNFVKEYPYEWQMEAPIFAQLKEVIELNSSLEVVNLEDMGITSSDNLDFVTVTKKQWTFVPETQATREKLQKNNIDVVIIVREAPTVASMECSQYGCSYHYSQGYGLFTRSIFGLDTYVASSSFNISMETLDTPIDVMYLEPFREIAAMRETNKILEDFSDPADFENITEEELAPVKKGIHEYFKKFAVTAKQFLNGDITASKKKG